MTNVINNKQQLKFTLKMPGRQIQRDVEEKLNFLNNYKKERKQST